ncbi:MAG: L,D-transpeptidase family protein [Bilifractor sp.]
MNKASNTRQKQRKKGLSVSSVILIVMLAVILAGIFTIFAIYQHAKHADTFMKNTTFNGADISGMTPSQVADQIIQRSQPVTINITENDQTVLTGDLTDYGYSLDKDSMTASLEKARAAQTASISAYIQNTTGGDNISADAVYSFDETTFDSFVQSSNFSVARVQSVEGAVTLDSSSNTYVVTQPVQGNEVDDTKLQAAVREAIDTASQNGTLTGTVNIAIPDDCYTSETVNTDTTDLQKEADEKNKELKLQAYKDMVITYQFGSQNETLTYDTFKDWLTIADDGSCTVDKDKAAAYVSDLANKYNTRHIEKTFKTTGGLTIDFPLGKVEYGYTVDEDSETAELIKDLEAGQSVSREPVYYQTNEYGNPYYYKRNGTDDLAGTYVEVDLTKQHLWFYKDGSLLLESDLVSGDLSKNQGTMTGIFPLAYKESPSTLVGANYSTKVQYWMPFFEGEGLHDAWWRTSFGGDIYKTNGSNGCLNLPSNVAQSIYENIDAGVAIVIYYEPGTEPADSTYATDSTTMADNVSSAG